MGFMVGEMSRPTTTSRSISLTACTGEEGTHGHFDYLSSMAHWHKPFRDPYLRFHSSAKWAGWWRLFKSVWNCSLLRCASLSSLKRGKVTRMVSQSDFKRTLKKCIWGLCAVFFWSNYCSAQEDLKYQKAILFLKWALKFMGLGSFFFRKGLSLIP